MTGQQVEYMFALIVVAGLDAATAQYFAKTVTAEERATYLAYQKGR